MECDEHFLTVCRYVERNALRANLVKRAIDWEWSSLHARQDVANPNRAALLNEWPVDRPSHWVDTVNRAETTAEHEALTRAIKTSRPFGNPSWARKISSELGLPEVPGSKGRPPVNTK
jgi:putative transposase